MNYVTLMWMEVRRMLIFPCIRKTCLTSSPCYVNNTSTSTDFVTHLGKRTWLPCPRTDISPRYDKLTNGRTRTWLPCPRTDISPRYDKLTKCKTGYCIDEVS